MPFEKKYIITEFYELSDEIKRENIPFLRKKAWHKTPSTITVICNFNILSQFFVYFGYFKILYQQFITHVPTNYVYPVIVSGYDYTHGNHKEYYPGVKGNFTFFFFSSSHSS